MFSGAPSYRFRASTVLVLATLSLGLAGCSSMGSWFGSGDKKEGFSDTPADKLYNQGLYELNQGDYERASKKFGELDKEHPYTEWARKANLMDTYTKYKSGDYDGAIVSAKRYMALHPASEDAAYAQFLLGMSYYNQIPDVERDQERTRKALNELDDVARKWPKSEYADAAREHAQVARDQLAGKEVAIGRFYLNQRNYVAAINRFKVVVQDYQQTRHVEEALARLAEAYMSLGVVTEAQTAAAILGHNFPDSQWYKDTYALIKSKGLEPREDTGSWMSKAFRKVVG